MLTLDKMELSGFKSFSDRTEVRFPAGITAVVGPNGCGKSNIGDAINWVLGEQSPKMLRGKQMADVIFAGSEGRKPLGLAEVSIHLKGAQGLGADDSGAMVVTRRLFRSGDSEYLLNGKRARLKDIQDLLAQGHVGARTYATIEQGRIDQILNAKPKDRRLIIEDAAGIGGYKHKRRLTELKLDATQANLLRVNDIIIEVDRQIRSLKRQAGKARRYRRLRDELRSQERVQFAVRSRRQDAELETAREAEARMREQEAEGAAALSKLEVQLLEERGALEDANRALREAADRLHRLEIEIDREETQIRACDERIVEATEIEARQTGEADSLAGRLAEVAERVASQQGRVESVTEEVEQIRSDLARQQSLLDDEQATQRDLRQAVEDLRRRQFEAMNIAAHSRNRMQSAQEAKERNVAQRQRLEAECVAASHDLTRLSSETESLAEQFEAQQRDVTGLREGFAACEARLDDAKQRHGIALEALTAAREQEQSALARLATLEDVSTRFAGVSDGVRALLNDGAAAGLRTSGVLADFIEASTGVESAAEGYLESFLPTVILESDDDVCRAAEMLRAEGAGRTSLICRSQPAGSVAVGTTPNGKGDIPAEVLTDVRVSGRLSEQLTLRASANGFIKDRLGDALVVDSLSTALDLHRRYPAVDYLTASGDVVYASGIVHAGGRAEGDHGLLAHQRQIREARSKAEQASSGAAERQQIVDSVRSQVELLEEELRRLRQDLDDGQRRLVELEMLNRRTADDHERSGRRSGVLKDELRGLHEEAEQLQVSLVELGTEVDLVEAECAVLEDEHRAKAKVLDEQEARLREESERAAALRESLAARVQNQQAAEQERMRLAENAADLQARLETARSEIDTARRRALDSTELRARTEAALATHLEDLKKLRTQVAQNENLIGELGRCAAAREDETKSSRQRLETLREGTRQTELERTRVESAREHLDDLCRQELGVTATQAVQEAIESGAELDDVQIEDLDAVIAKMKDDIEKIGPVNMTAIEEFAELEERHAFLSTQRHDLDRSMDSLKETIRRINRSSRDRFAEAFEAIRAYYQETYKLLFNGGRADLRMEEGEDVLECGIEILAQPPGKRLANINLLSGGEKALSAIALLFAVFRYQPSPFCLLDEVDAALDESNVGRFARMLSEYAQHTQFIIVTHNKLTMEAADLLYGVTMEEPGVSRLISLQLD